jgi:eukaryotic-like serine/threonine-protein kinase
VPHDGSQRWRQDLQGAIRASIAGWEDLALAGTESGSLEALDTQSGVVRWSVQLDGPVTVSPAIESGIAYAVADGGQLLAVDAGSGHVAWEHQLGTGVPSTPAVRERVLYLLMGPEDGGGPSELVALEVGSAPDAGGPRDLWRWHAPTDERFYLAAVTDDLVYVTGHEASVYAIDATTGAGELLLPTEGSVGPTAAVVGDDLYVGSADRTVRAVDRHTGEVRWSVAIPGDPTSPAVHDGRILVGTNLGRLVAIGGRASPD